ncbi:hypothetical protein [Acetobacter sp.]|uniref:hypothetical protein n=1 Tax=Acetobacter sp. TaxID=440 RepID=UPI0039EC2C97
MSKHVAGADPFLPTRISVQDAVTRVTEILARAHADCVAAQGAVEISTRGVALNAQDMQSVQVLDRATQTVEAAGTVLHNLLALMGPAAMPSVDLARLSAGVKLHDIVLALRGEQPAPPAIPAGDIDLF